MWDYKGKITELASQVAGSLDEGNPARDADDHTEEADKVSARIAALLSEKAFSNYNDLRNGIHETTEFLELFLRNLLLNENHPLHNRALHISGTFKTPEKVNIEDQNANMEREKTNIENSFTAKTASHVYKLLEAFGFQTIFGRSDVQEILGLKPTRSTALLKEMAEKGFVEPVMGLGKGKYRFRQHKGWDDEISCNRAP